MSEPTVINTVFKFMCRKCRNDDPSLLWVIRTTCTVRHALTHGIQLYRNDTLTCEVCSFTFRVDELSPHGFSHLP